MKVQQGSYKNILKKLFYLCGALIAFTIPLSIRFNSYAIILFAVLFLLNLSSRNFSVNKISPWLFCLFISFYLFEVVSLLYSVNKDEGISVLQKKISLLVFPLLLAFIRDFNIKIVLKGLIVGCLLALLVCYSYAIFRFIATADFDEFFYEKFTEPIRIQPTYFALHISLALLIIVNELKDSSLLKSRTKIIYWAMIFLFFISILFLSSRTILFIISIILLYEIYFTFLKKGSLLLKTCTLVILIISGYIFIGKSPVLKSRIMDMVKTKFYFSPGENNANGLTLRLVKWQCSIEGIEGSPFKGVGTGDAQKYLQDCYKEKNFWGQVFQYNSHNQFLQIGLASGVVTMLFYLLSLLVPLFISIKHRNILYAEFLILIIVLSLTESLLERQQGVVLYSFFNAVFAFHSFKRP